MGYTVDDLRLIRLRQLANDETLFKWAVDRFFEARKLHLFDSVMEAPGGGEEAHLLISPEGPLAFATHWRPYPGHKFVWVSLLFVDPGWRRRGLASRLLTDLRNNLPDGYEIGFGTMAANDAMMALAAKLGFAIHSTNFRAMAKVA